jgi:hypothetical protein
MGGGLSGAHIIMMPIAVSIHYNYLTTHHLIQHKTFYVATHIILIPIAISIH